MTPQKLLHFAEFSFQQIGRIRDAQVGKTLAGKQPWQMPFQAVVRSAQALMRVVCVACFLVHTAFVQESCVLLLPALEGLLERRLSGISVRVSDRARSACAAGLLGGGAR